VTALILRLFGATSEADVRPAATLGDADLLRRARTGDSEAPRELLRRHGQRLARVAYATVGDWSAAEDVVQETVVRAIAEVDRLREDASVVSWLSRIAVRVAIDGKRKTHRETLFAEPPEEDTPTTVRAPSPEVALSSAESRTMVARAMAQLPPATREVLALRYDAGFTAAEIAELTGKSEVAVRKELQRARDRLRTLLAPWFEGEQ
jgi:RNA polymerase sigma-70 factor (ECF subfamily)